MLASIRGFIKLILVGFSVSAGAGLIAGPAAAQDVTAPRVQSVSSALYSNDDIQYIQLLFTEPVNNIDASDFTVVGSTATITDFSSPYENAYSLEISGGDLADIADTDLSLGLAGGQDITDLAGNPLTTIASLGGWTHVNVNNTRPAPVFTSAAVAPVSQPFTVNLAFPPTPTEWTDSIINGTLTQSDIVVGNGTIESFTLTSTGEGYQTGATIVIRPAADGPVTVDLPENAVYDEASNQNTAATQFSINADIDPPTVSIFKPGAACPCTSAITVTIVFSESNITGFDVSDLTASGATLSGFTFNGRSGSVTMTPTGDGTMTLDIAAGAAVDSDGFGNVAAPQFSAVIDTTRPTVTLSTAAAAPVTGEFDINIQFSEPMTNIGNTGVWTMSGGSRLSVTGSGANYVMRARPQQGAQGTLTLDLAENGFSDAAGNGVVAPAQFQIAYDRANPRIASVARFSPSEATTNADSLTFTVTFSEDVTNVDAGDFDIYTLDYAPANTTATITNVTPVSASVYRVTVSGGNLDSLSNTTITLNGRTDGNIRDAANNVMTVRSPQTTPEGYTMDNAAPAALAFARQSPSASKTNSDTLTWQVTFSEAVTVDAADFALTGTTAGLSVSVPAADQAETSGIASFPAPLPSSTTWLVTASGGDLAALDGEVGLNFSGSQDIADSVGNTLAGTEPATDEVFDVRNSDPALASITRLTPAGSLTNADSLVWRLTFSQIDGSFDLPTSAFTVAGSTATVTNVSRFSIGFDVTVSGGDLAGLNGDVTLGLADTDFQDDYGNVMDRTIPAGAELTYTLDNIVPSVEITSAAGTLVNGDFDITITFSEPVTGFDVNDIVRSNTGRYDFSGSGAVYTVTMAPNDSPFTIDIPAGAAQDSAGNDNTAATQFVGTVDSTRPTVTLSTTAGIVTSGHRTVSGPFTLDIEFSETVEDFVIGDLSLTNATASNFSGSGTTYSVLITPTPNAQIEILLEGNAFSDPAGNLGFGAQLEVDDDQTPPRVFNLQRLTPADARTSADVLVWLFQTNENTIDVDAADFTVTGTSAAITDVTSDAGGTRYEISVSGGDLAGLNGDVTLGLAPGQNITDYGGNTFADTTPFGTHAPTYTLDNTSPSVALSTGATIPSGPFTLNIAFSEAVTAFTVEDLVIGNGTASDFAAVAPAGDGAPSTAPLPASASYTVTITPASDGPVTVDVAAGAANDAVGNPSLAASQFSILADLTAPGVASIARLTPTVSPTDADALTWRVTFSEPVSNVSGNDFAVTGTTASVTGVTAVSTAIYDIQVSGGDLATINAIVTLGFAGGQDIEDAAGNALADTAPTGTDERSWSIINDQVAPRVASITRIAPTELNPTGSDTLHWRVTFDEEVTQVDAGDFIVTGTTAIVSEITPQASDPQGQTGVSAPAATSGTRHYDVLVSGGDLADLNGTVTLDFSSGQNITDLAGNALADTTPTSANNNTFVVDNAGSTITWSGPSSVNTAFILEIAFNEPITGFEIGDLVVGNGTASNLTSTPDTWSWPAGYEALYSVTITPSLSGIVTVDIADDAATDLAGNGSQASVRFAATYDQMAPRLATIQRVAPTELNPTGSDTLYWRVTFDESVAGVDSADFNLDGTTATVQASPVAAGLPPSMVSNGTPTFPAQAFSNTAYDVTASGGDLADLNGVVTLTLVSAPDIADLAGNALVNTAPTGANNNTFIVDNTGATATLATNAAAPVSGAFTLDITFNEPVTGFEIGDLVVGNGTASNLTFAPDTWSWPAGYETLYSVTITPTSQSPVTVEIGSGTATDLAGNDNQAAAQFSIASDTLRTLTVTLPGVGAGTVTSASAGISCGTDCTEEYTVGADVTLTAAADTGSTFAGWTAGPCAGTSTASCVVPMNADQTVSARFTLDTPPAGRIVASTLPGARSGHVGGPAMSAFLSVVSRTTSPAQGCTVAAPSGAPVTLSYRQVDGSNMPIGPADPLFDLPSGGTLSFVLELLPTALTAAGGYDFLPVIDCENASLDPIVGVNSVLLNIGAAPTPDILSSSATPSGDGVIRIPSAGGVGIISAAALNIGVGDGSGGPNDVTLTVAADTGAAVLPVTIDLCQIDSATAACVTPRAASVTVPMSGSTPLFFAAFVRDTSTGGIAFDPANARVFLRFSDATGAIRSATSAAVTAPAPSANEAEIANGLPAGRWSALVRQPDGVWPGLARASLYVFEDGNALIDTGTAITTLDLDTPLPGEVDGAARFRAGHLTGYWTLQGDIRIGAPWAETVGELWGVRDARSDRGDGMIAPGRYTERDARRGEGLTVAGDGSISGVLGGCLVNGAASAAPSGAPGLSVANLTFSSCAQPGDYRAVMDPAANDNETPQLIVGGPAGGWRLGR
ncbi:Ig-like domain-containing protein [Hyphobacterium marinum]|uniref:Ig-like domain-containing protein n=1 Tax=Hyphobacterium marinum TaxID=3116574 RepID=A0ABU7LVP9_9PROT|nr:Ig-like domain-containing protein [Hyphobacterium sp. Y6023]MEE2565050.1 Ig-like domain-containing protein [Hyphobacterium sp. Y6023]